ncbi:MAG TPA: hypothetical protein VET25_02740 [Aestuariivirgaceae bacterium]|nr:hypothetical protein [Aestuariivirgaceae bacterium]
MSDRATRLKEVLETLSFEDRAALAHFLIDSLTHEPDDVCAVEPLTDDQRRMAIAVRLSSDEQLARIATEIEPAM